MFLDFITLVLLIKETLIGIQLKIQFWQMNKLLMVMVQVEKKNERMVSENSQFQKNFNEIDNLNGWFDKVKIMQRNWLKLELNSIFIGKYLYLFKLDPTQFLEQLLLRYHLSIHFILERKADDFIKFCEKNSTKELI